jgi:Flp pilus assembly protein TadG
MNAVTQIAAPYGNSGMGVLVAELTTDANKKTTVTWNKSLNAPGLVNGAAFTLPANMAQASTSLIYARVTYAYTPPVGQQVFGTIPISSDFYIPPRLSSDVTLN